MKRLLCLLTALACLVTLLPTVSATSTKHKLIALTFDDGPGGPTPRLLDGLAERGAKATFFMLGQCASYSQKTVRRAFLEGHEIASHTYSHYQLTAKTDETVRSEVQRTDALLDEILGMDLDYLVRPPYGSADSRVLQLLDAPAVIWSLDTLDWKYRDAEYVCNQIVNNAYNGVIVLCHDIHATSVDGALAAIDILQAQGYEFVTVSELYRRRGVQMNKGEKYSTCMRDESDIGGVSAPEATLTQTLGGTRLTMLSSQGAPLWYRLDDETVFHEYTGPVTFNGAHKIECCAAYNINGGRSASVTLSTQKAETLADATASVQNGKFVFTPAENTQLLYTLDGSDPSADSPTYSAPLDVFDGTLCVQSVSFGGAGRVVRYTACKEGWLLTDIALERGIEKTTAFGAKLSLLAALETK